MSNSTNKNMKKLIISVVVAAAIGLGSIHAATVTTVLLTGQFTNLLTGFPGSTYIKSYTISAATNSATVYVYDTPTNKFAYTNGAYTYRQISVTNNYITSWTNYYGVAQSYTNIALFSTNLVTSAATTNSYPIRAVLGAASGTTVQYPNQQQVYNYGIWATNAGSGIATITITY